MSWRARLGRFFRVVQSILATALGFAKEHGLDDALIDRALEFVVEAADKTLTGREKALWVVIQLKDLGVPGWIARAAVELAYGLYMRRRTP